MKIAVIGANGQLGTDLCGEFSRGGNEVTGLVHDDIEISSIDETGRVLEDIRPDVVINTAAFHVVPECEQEPERAFRVNSLGSLNLARACDRLGCAFVQYSTDYVFDGAKKKPYTEDDMPNPLNVYAATKLAGEYFTRNYCDRHFVIRVAGLYGKVVCRAKGANFITTMMKAAAERPVVKVVNDEELTPTPTSAIAKNTLALVESGAFGLYHMTANGSCSWHEFATVIFETLKLKTPLEPCSVNDFPLEVKRPFYSVLENRGLKQLGLDLMPPWRDALVDFLKQNYQ
ncbi:MAG: dTDP-4-dehydrorhamnose reductase [Actinomycetota bacterium]